MAATSAIEWHRIAVLGAFLVQVGRELQTAIRQRICWIVLVLGLVNLAAGLILGTDWLPTFVALDITYANFAWVPWTTAVYLASQPPRAPFGAGITAKVLASAIMAGATLTAAGFVAMAVQLWRGAAPIDWPQVLAGLYANLGLGSLHLALVAAAMQAILGDKWLSMSATATVWIGMNLGFDHPLLRIGAPINPASGMNGFGPFVASDVAAGIHWTGFCIVLLATGVWVAARRSANAAGPKPGPLGPNAFAVVWTATVAWVVSGAWILHNASLGRIRRSMATRRWQGSIRPSRSTPASLSTS